jgi:dienelactone hydrolase
VRRRVLLTAAGLAALAGCRATRAVSAPSTGPSSRSSAPAPAATPVLFSGHAPARALRVTPYQHVFHRGSRTLPTLVYAPAAAGRFPLVVFGHGLTGLPGDYAALLTRWCAAGFVVAAPAFPDTNRSAAHFSLLDVPNQPEDLSAVLSGLLSLPGSDPVGRRVEPAHVAVAGHSAGAITALGALTDDGPGGRDRRFTAAVILAGNLLGVGQRFSDPPVPVLFVHSRNDPIVPYATGKAAYDGLPWPKALLTLSGAEHSEPYLDPRDRQFATVSRTSTDFLRASLYGDAAARHRLAGVPHLRESGLG